MAKKTIKLKKYLDIINEYVANAAITPGNLIELMSTGKVRKHSTSGGNATAMFALEDELQGKDIDDDYAAAAPVQCWTPVRGEEVFAWLANGETAVIGSLLASNGDGTLKVYTAPSVGSAEVYTDYQDPIVGLALEAVDMSGSDLVDPTGRIKIRIF